jgi:hypothetical protein
MNPDPNRNRCDLPEEVSKAVLFHLVRPLKPFLDATQDQHQWCCGYRVVARSCMPSVVCLHPDRHALHGLQNDAVPAMVTAVQCFCSTAACGGGSCTHYTYVP